MEYITLNNGIAMPAAGFGVYKLNQEETCVSAVKCAIESGYRLIDTAAMYGNEPWVGKAVRESGVPRSELFVATKLWIHQTNYEGAKMGFERSLKRLGLDYVDMFLLHWPFGADVVGAWRALEELYREGRVRSIGVSNFTVPHLKELMKTAAVVPAVNQVECQPLLQQPELYEFLKANNIRMEAWSPIGRMNPRILEKPLFGELAEKYGKSPVQIILRWHLQRGVTAIPKSSSPERIRANLDIFDFSISEEDMARLAALDEGWRTNDDPGDPTTAFRLGSRPCNF